MFPLKLILGFLGRFALIIGLLIIPWPGVGETYARFLRATGQSLYGSFGGKGIVIFRINHDAGDTLQDTKIYLGNRDRIGPDGQLQAAHVKFSTRYTGYLPAALVAALILATPVPWRRRGWSLLCGMFLIHAFAILILGLIILYQYSETQALGLHQFSPTPKKILNGAHEILVRYLGPYFAVPVFVWIVATFRREDWSRILGAVEPSGKHPASK